MKKKFSLAAILSITQPRLLCSMDEIYKILGFIVGDSDLMTHQIPRAANTARPYLKEKYPEFSLVDEVSAFEESLKGVAPGSPHMIAEINSFLELASIKLGGQEFEIEAMPDNAFERINPILELLSMMKKD